MRIYKKFTIVLIFTIALITLNSSQALDRVLIPTFEYKLSDGKKIYFLNKKDGEKAIIDDRDYPYYSLMTPLEISIRMKIAGIKMNERIPSVSRVIFKEHVRKSVRDWSEEEITYMTKVLKTANKLCNKVLPDLIPLKWSFIKTSGNEEGGNFYTRTGYIIVPQQSLNKLKKHPKKRFKYFVSKMIHETFHIYSRYHPKKRDQLYKVIGFSKIGDVNLNDFLSKRKITNPDATDLSYSITVKSPDGRLIQAVLVIYSKYPSYQKGNNRLFSYISLGLFEIKALNDNWTIMTDKNKKAHPIDFTTVNGFYEQIGRNTSYIIHPEEIIADNVVLLVFLRSNYKKRNLTISNAIILEKIKQAFISD